MRMDTGSYWFVIRPFSAGNMRLVQRGSGEGGVPWEKEREKEAEEWSHSKLNAEKSLTLFSALFFYLFQGLKWEKRGDEW